MHRTLIFLAILFAVVDPAQAGPPYDWGDIPSNATGTKSFYFNTVDITDGQAPLAAITGGAISSWEDANTTADAAGLTLVNHATLTGVYRVDIATSNARFVNGHTYTIYFTAGTVAGVPLQNRVLAYFTKGQLAIVNATNGVMEANLKQVDDDAAAAAALESYTDGTTPMPVNATHWLGTALATPDTAGYPKTTVKDGGGVGEINTNGGAIEQTLLVSVVSALGSGAIAPNSIQGDAFTAAKFASDVTTEFQSGLPNATRDALLDAVLSGHTTAGTLGKAVGDISSALPDGGEQIAGEDAVAAGSYTPVSADVVGDSYTWFARRYRATNIVEVESGYVGPLALEPDMNPDVTIATVDSVTITGAATVTASGLTVDRSRTKAQWTVPALTTEGTYTVRVKVTTVENQQITTTGTLKVY